MEFKFRKPKPEEQVDGRIVSFDKADPVAGKASQASAVPANAQQAADPVPCCWCDKDLSALDGAALCAHIRQCSKKEFPDPAPALTPRKANIERLKAEFDAEEARLRALPVYSGDSESLMDVIADSAGAAAIVALNFVDGQEVLSYKLKGGPINLRESCHAIRDVVSGARPSWCDSVSVKWHHGYKGSWGQRQLSRIKPGQLAASILLEKVAAGVVVVFDTDSNLAQCYCRGEDVQRALGEQFERRWPDMLQEIHSGRVLDVSIRDLPALADAEAPATGGVREAPITECEHDWRDRGRRRWCAKCGEYEAAEVAAMA
jgi:hypothetical protein